MKEKCCCGYEPPPPPKPHVNNVQTHGSMYCCGMVELGNFNYDDPPGAKSMTHYHKVGGSWQVQGGKDRTTLEDVKARLQGAYGGAVVCSTGSGQEYMEPILTELGFNNVATFRNPGHANTNVKLWVKVLHEPV